jgi:hypothetical protein
VRRAVSMTDALKLQAIQQRTLLRSHTSHSPHTLLLLLLLLAGNRTLLPAASRFMRSCCASSTSPAATSLTKKL